MRKALLALCLGSLFVPCVQSVERPSHERLHEYRRGLYGKHAIGGSALAAGAGQIRNVPHEWRRGPSGFAKRFGSHLGEHAIAKTIELGVGTLDHEDLHYQRSNLHGALPRMKYAVVHTFIVPRKNRRGKTVAFGRISGNLGAGVISRAWQPASTAGLGAGLASGGIGLGAEVGVNVAHEFWPRKHAHVRKLVSRSHAAARPRA